MKRILVADDNDISRELVREVLEAPGRLIVEAADGEQALERIGEQLPDVVLLDIQMPALDGFAVLRRLRHDPRTATLPVLALTAFAMEGDRTRALAAGFDAYITKPIDAAALRRQVEQLLGVHSE